jgi:hypothetical protein
MPGSAAATSRSAADEGNAEIVRLPLAKGAHKSAMLQGIDAATLAQRRRHALVAALLQQEDAGVE